LKKNPAAPRRHIKEEAQEKDNLFAYLTWKNIYYYVFKEKNDEAHKEEKKSWIFGEI